MKVSVRVWTIKKLVSLRDKINEQPVYQRGEVWKDPKNRLLVDSILRGIDIPKIYLRKLINSAYTYEVADGQQRLNAIYKFIDGDLDLDTKNINGLDLSKINGLEVGGLNIKDDEFPNKLVKIFNNYKLTVAVVENATGAEIRTLFGRLQLGDPLTPAEKRNAIISQVGPHIDNFAINHKFFVNSRILENRYKRQDYLAHVFALIEYQNSEDLKAELLQKLYLKKKAVCNDSNIIKKVAFILDLMYQIDTISKKRIINKFAFVDIFWFLYNNCNEKSKVDVKGFADDFDNFETDRISYNKNPERLIRRKNVSRKDKNLYDYIIAFNLAGALVGNITKRNKSISYFFEKYII